MYKSLSSKINLDSMGNTTKYKVYVDNTTIT